jgi:hypothetical protein
MDHAQQVLGFIGSAPMAKTCIIQTTAECAFNKTYDLGAIANLMSMQRFQSMCGNAPFDALWGRVLFRVLGAPARSALGRDKGCRPFRKIWVTTGSSGTIYPVHSRHVT